MRPPKISTSPISRPYIVAIATPCRSPFLIRSGCLAPIFWLQNTDAEVAIASNGHIANCLILMPAVNPETHTLPSPLFADCITILPIAVMENCSPVGSPIARSSFTAVIFTVLFSFVRCSTFIFLPIKTRHSMPLIACAVIVAAAAPAHPHFSTTIQNRSRKIFNIAENARKRKGVRLSPSERRILDK